MPSYTVDPTNPLTPTNLQGAKQGAEELRGIKARINGIIVETLATAQDRFVNGKFYIDQRDTDTTPIAVNSSTPTYGPDMWAGVGTPAAGVFTIEREPDALYPGEYRMKINVTTADAALAAGDAYCIIQAVEGIYCTDLEMGVAGAEQITIAFEIESELAGTFPIAIRNSAVNRSYVGTFNVDLANTRETKVVTLILDTSGTWLTNTGVGLSVTIGLAFGTTYNAAAPNVWSAGNFLSVAGTTNFMATNGNTMWLKNCRLYRGANDLGVNQRLYAQEFDLCTRCYQLIGFSAGAVLGWARTDTTSSAYFSIPLPIPMREIPTVTMVASGGINVNDGLVDESASTLGTNNSTIQNLSLSINTSGATLTPGRPALLSFNTAASGFKLSADLL